MLQTCNNWAAIQSCAAQDPIKIFNVLAWNSLSIRVNVSNSSVSISWYHFMPHNRQAGLIVILKASRYNIPN